MTVELFAGYAGPLNLNTQLVGHPNGAVVPVDEPAVQAARADHLAAKGAIAYAAPALGLAHPGYAGYPAVPAVPAAVGVAGVPALVREGSFQFASRSQFIHLPTIKPNS